MGRVKDIAIDLENEELEEDDEYTDEEDIDEFEEENREYYRNVLAPQVSGLNKW